jgi:LPXTG-motif cell wall-anchored protein
MIRKVSLTLVVAVGVFWLASTLVFGYSKKTQAVDNLTNSFRPAFTNASLAQGGADIRVATNFAQQFQTQAVPALAKQLNLTPEQFVHAVGTQYPAVGNGINQLPQILTYFDTVQRTMSAQQSNFHQADAIPTKSLPNTTVHWMFVILGISALAAGGAGFVLRRRIVAVLAGVLGVGVIATTHCRQL